MAETDMLDDIDRRLLALLQEDATRPVSELAAIVGLSTTPCWKRIHKLREDGVITK
ncbi:MAG: Lrp/AsnC family transcriptional regulator, partial [Caldimonas sp.]